MMHHTAVFLGAIDMLLWSRENTHVFCVYIFSDIEYSHHADT